MMLARGSRLVVVGIAIGLAGSIVAAPAGRGGVAGPALGPMSFVAVSLLLFARLDYRRAIGLRVAPRERTR
jgi:hypothetical protein